MLKSVPSSGVGRFGSLRLISLCLLLVLGRFGCLAADESAIGTYEGETVVSGKAMKVTLELVTNPKYGNNRQACDGMLTLSPKQPNAHPSAPLMLTCDIKREPLPHRRADPSPMVYQTTFHLRQFKASEEFGGLFEIQALREGDVLKGTLSLLKRDPIPLGSKIDSAVTLKKVSGAPEAPAEVTAVRPNSLDRNDIAGVYVGSFTTDNRLFLASLQLGRSAAGELTGKLGFKAAPNTPELGSVRVKGKYDATDATLSLTRDESAYSASDIQVATMQGHFDPASGRLEGKSGPDEATFELARDDEKSAQIQASSRQQIDQFKEAPRSLAQAKNDEQRRLAIVHWFGRLKQEYPNIDLHHTVVNELSPKVLNLYCDEEFVPVFGKTFDALTPDDRYFVREIFLRLFEHEPGRSMIDGFAGQLERPFMLDTGSFSFSDVAPQVAFRRSVRRKWNEAMAQLKAVPQTLDGFHQVVALEKNKQAFKDLWPSESKEFEDAADAAKRAIAEPAIQQGVEAAVSGADGIDGARRLSHWAKDQEVLLNFVSPEIRDKCNNTIVARIEELLQPPLRDEVQKLAGLGEGVQAVMAGNKWYRNLRSTYDFANDRPVVQKAVDELKARRGADLRAAQDQIIAEIDKQGSAEQVNQVKMAYLGAPGDEETVPAAAINQAADLRKQAIRHEQAMAFFSPHERQWLISGGDSIVPPPDAPEPDEDDLRVAIARTLEMMGGERVEPFTVHWSNPIIQQLGIVVILKINKVQKLQAERVPGGYKVAYRTSINIDYPEKLKQFMFGQPSFGGSMLQGYIKLINGNPQGMQEGRFELSEKGWWCPTMAENRGLSGD